MSDIVKWEKDPKTGERYPVYTNEQAQRIARAAWLVHFFVPHPDEEPTYADGIREFNRALIAAPPLPNCPVSVPCVPENACDIDGHCLPHSVYSPDEPPLSVFSRPEEEPND